MALLKSRTIPTAFESLEGLQLGRSITYAEEALRGVLKAAFGGVSVMEQREIIVPKDTNRSELLHDPDGIVMKGDLADDVAHRMWERLTDRQKVAIDSAQYRRYRKLQNDDFETRTVFFRSTVRLGEAPESKKVTVVARVVAFALSGWWHMAEVRMWHSNHGEDNQVYIGAEYQVDGHIYEIIPGKEWQPPRFLVETKK